MMARQTDEQSVELFLDLLERSIESGVCKPLPPAMVRKLEALSEGVALNLDAPIEGEVEI